MVDAFPVLAEVCRDMGIGGRFGSDRYRGGETGIAGSVQETGDPKTQGRFLTSIFRGNCGPSKLSCRDRVSNVRCTTGRELYDEADDDGSVGEGANVLSFD